MKIAIMQPYFMPYIGYFQLIDAVDKFVVLDDVNFIKRGWINRNYVLVSNERHLFTIPLKKSSQNKLINQISISDYGAWRDAFLRKIEIAYRKAPFFKDVFPLVRKIINNDEVNISRFNYSALKEVTAYLSISTDIISSSSIYNNTHLKGQEKIIDICMRENAEEYINMAGGVDLYDSDVFLTNGIKLCFLKTTDIFYKQYTDNNVSNFSIIDFLFFNDITKVKELLGQYKVYAG